jgi:hypothetical protein
MEDDFSNSVIEGEQSEDEPVQRTRSGRNRRRAM